MSTLPPAPVASPTSPPFGPAGWPPEPSKPSEPARPRSQVAVFAVCALAMGIVCGAAGTLGWGFAGMLALGAGVAVGLAADLRVFRSFPGAVAALITMMVVTVALAFVGPSTFVFALVPLIGAFVLGLDWWLVRRLRPLPFAFGFLVVIGVASGDTWTYPAGLAWLALALGALASLEADRRVAQPRVEAVTAGPGSPDVQPGDLATTILVALALALVAALVLSTPSCRPPDSPKPANLGSPPSGLGQPGSGGTGSGSGGGQGTGRGTGSGTGSDHLYVPDPHGRFLIPNGTGPSSGSSRTGVPSPELLPPRGERPRSSTLDDGTHITAERDSDGTGHITVTDPDGTERTYTYRERSDGLTEIQELDEDGTPGRTLYYDPQGRVASDDRGAVSGSDPSGGDDPASQSAPDKAARSHLDGRLLALLVLVLAAVGGLIWWLTRRPPRSPAPEAPPWALRLARDIEHEGAARGTARGRTQSLTRYADVLRTGALADDRVPAVADVVSTALFARSDPGPEAQRWAETTWAEIVAAHPVPNRSDRRRAAAGSPPA